MSADACTAFPDPPVAEEPNTRLRAEGGALFSLVELDPRRVVTGLMVADGFAAEDVMPVGRMRELCPHCDVPLQLVLRANHVIRSHLFCEQCTRCFDAVYPGGGSALLFPRLPDLY